MREVASARARGRVGAGAGRRTEDDGGLGRLGDGGLDEDVVDVVLGADVEEAAVLL